MFAIAFTNRRKEQAKANCYAQSAQIRKVRAKMIEIMTNEASKAQLRDLVKKLIPEAIGKAIEKQCMGIFPLENAFIRKVKILKKPKFDPVRLQELHKDTGDDVGAGMGDGKLSEEAQNTLTASIQAQNDDAE